MPAARFSVGQSLFLLKDLRSATRQAEGIYRVVKVMPNEGRETTYRIKHENEAFDRVVSESQLAEPEGRDDKRTETSRNSKARI